VPPHHADYLDLLTEVVEATRDIEIDRQRTAPPIHSRRKGSTREERHSARGVYEFQLLRPAQLDAGAPVYITDEPDLRGRVTRIADREVVVRFDAAIDYRKMPSQWPFRCFRATVSTGLSWRPSTHYGTIRPPPRTCWPASSTGACAATRPTCKPGRASILTSDSSPRSSGP
jgi:hypothetical protein